MDKMPSNRSSFTVGKGSPLAQEELPEALASYFPPQKKQTTLQKIK